MSCSRINSAAAALLAIALLSASTMCLGRETPSAPTQVDLAPFLKQNDFDDVKLSPTGEYYAATVPFEDRTTLVVVRRADSQPMVRFSLGKDSYVGSFHWVSPTRLVLGMAEKFGQLDKPIQTGELYAVDADGAKPEMLVGFRVVNETGSRIGGKKAEDVAAFMLDDLPADDRNVLVSIVPFGKEPITRVERLDVHTGRRVAVARVDVAFASFITDNAGEVRFAVGVDKENYSKLLHRRAAGAPWDVVNDERSSGHVESVLGFAADNRTAYLVVEQSSGPNAIVAYDADTGQRRPVIRDETVDPAGVIPSIRRADGMVGATFVGGSRRNVFFDQASADARLTGLLETAFKGRDVAIKSATSDGLLALVEVTDPTSVGDFYFFDTQTKAATYFASRTRAFDPKAMGQVRPVSIRARDGLVLHGFLTLPPNSSGRSLPTVVYPHGGPFDEFDVPAFDTDAQILAHAGYAVLQINFRGSGNYGRAFLHAGARQWGRAMQDDLTDATRWLVEQKVADARRICLHGASYGAYAALMGVASEPSLYRCASGYVGVYDLPMMVEDDRRLGRRAKIWTDDWIGSDPIELAKVSPSQMADRIKVPVFLAAGGEDKRAPVEQTKRMEAALKRSGVSVQALYKPLEGHGFYTEANRRDYYTRLLAFFAAHLGGKTAK